jgi:hypothetical protein
LANPTLDKNPDAEPVVGFAISFPYSEHVQDTEVEYVVNEVWLQQAFGDAEPEVDEDEDVDE